MDIRKAALTAICVLATPACADPISGYVHADGTVAIPSSLYTVTHTRRGSYNIKFTNPLEPSASCVITPLSDVAVKTLVESDKRCFVNFGVYGEYRADTDFSFIAVPMSN
jgi:hypothetical protein